MKDFFLFVTRKIVARCMMQLQLLKFFDIISVLDIFLSFGEHIAFIFASLTNATSLLCNVPFKSRVLSMIHAITYFVCTGNVSARKFFRTKGSTCIENRARGTKHSKTACCCSLLDLRYNSQSENI